MAAQVMRADDIQEIERVMVEFDGMGKAPARHTDLYVRISTDVGVPVSELQERRARWHLSWGELYMLHLLAWHSHQSFEIILADYRSGRGWGVLAQAHGLKLGQIVSAAHKSEKAWKEQSPKGGPRDQAELKGDASPKGGGSPGSGKGQGSGKGKK